MLTDEQLIQGLQDALERESAGIVPPPDLLASIHNELAGWPAAQRYRRRARPAGRRLRLAHLAPVAALAVVVAVVAVFVSVHSREPTGSAATHGGFELVFRAEPTPQVSVVNRVSVARAVMIMRRRIAAMIPGGAASVTVNSVGVKIFVHERGRARASRKALLFVVGMTPRLEFYDWEANALTPSGQTVASQLASQNPAALGISGQGSAPVGSPGAGSMALYQAVQLAARQPYEASTNNARFGPEYFAFAESGSPSCAAAARAYHATEIADEPCPLLSFPATSLSGLYSSLPQGVNRSETQVMTVKQGTVILQAIPNRGYGHELSWADPGAQYFILRDHVSLFGNEITNPRQSTDLSGQPDLTFGFTSKGQTDFQNLTSAIAHRAALAGGFGHVQEDQHFAVALDTQLITVPQIDYKQYPDGITASNRADVSGGFTIQSARDLAAQLRLGALPLNLKLIAVGPRR